MIPLGHPSAETPSCGTPSGLAPSRASRWWRLGVLAAVVATVVALLVWRFSDWAYDDPFITFRYAQSLLAGHGLTYNAGERVLSTTTPLFAVLLALLGTVVSDIPKAAIAVDIACLAIAAVTFWRLCRTWALPWSGWAGLLLLPVFPLVVSTLGSEIPLAVALTLLILLAYAEGAYLRMALLCSCLELVRPDCVLLPVVLWALCWFRTKGKYPLAAFAVFLAISAVSWGALWLYFGSPLPVTLAVKRAQGTMTISKGFATGLWDVVRPYQHRWNYAVELVLAGLGLPWLWAKRSPALLLIVWTAVYFVAFVAIGATFYFWYYAPLVPGFILLVGAGLDALAGMCRRIPLPAAVRGRHLKLVLPVTLVVLSVVQAFHLHWTSIFPDRRAKIYREAGLWLDANTPATAKVGTVEVGIIGYYARRSMVDFAGLLQPAVAGQMGPLVSYDDTGVWALRTYRPDYVVVQEGLFRKIEHELDRGRCAPLVRLDARQFRAPWNLVIYRCGG